MTSCILLEVLEYCRRGISKAVVNTVSIGRGFKIRTGRGGTATNFPDFGPSIVTRKAIKTREFKSTLLPLNSTSSRSHSSKRRTRKINWMPGVDGSSFKNDLRCPLCCSTIALYLARLEGFTRASTIVSMTCFNKALFLTPK